MKTIISALIVMLAVFFSNSALAALDFGREVLLIPDTHETAKYMWPARDNPADFRALIHRQSEDADNWLLTLQVPIDEQIEEIHLFIVDAKFKDFVHITPRRYKDGVYIFSLQTVDKGKHHLETILKTDHGWVRLSQEFDAGPGNPERAARGEEGVTAAIKTVPAKVYAGHVATFVFEINKDGKPITDLGRIDGFDMLLVAWKTSWFTKFGEFVYARSAQNLGGPEVAVSLVFKKHGRHKIFAQYKQGGEVHTITTEIEVYFEPSGGSGGIESMQPVDD